MRWQSVVVATTLAMFVSAVAVVSAQDNVNRGQSAEGCADALPIFAQTCRTLSALLPRAASGFGTPTTPQVFSPLMSEKSQPADPGGLGQLPLLRWDTRASGWGTSLARASCWLEAAGAILRCAFDHGTDETRAAERHEELVSVLHEIAPVEWNYTASPRSLLLSDGQVVRASVHRVNFAAPDWIGDSPNARWKVLLSFGRLGRHDEVPRETWAR